MTIDLKPEQERIIQERRSRGDTSEVPMKCWIAPWLHYGKWQERLKGPVVCRIAVSWQ